MKSNKLALIAIGLWLLTIALLGWFFIYGHVTAEPDARPAIVLKPAERDLVLREMRGLLSATHGVLEGITLGDINLVIQHSRSAGMAAAADANPALMAKLPLDFKSLGMRVHQDMDEIARAAESGRPAPELLQMLTGTMSKCVACHAAWQLKAESLQ